METKVELPIIVERTKRKAALYALGAIACAAIYLYGNGLNIRFGGHNVTLIILVVGLFGHALLELNAKGYAFGIFDEGIDERSLGGVGYVGWEEMESCHVRTLHGQPTLAIRPRSPRAFWAARGHISHIHLILYRIFWRKSIAIAWGGQN